MPPFFAAKKMCEGLGLPPTAAGTFLSFLVRKHGIVHRATAQRCGGHGEILGYV
jgi:hypothetical protein